MAPATDELLERTNPQEIRPDGLKGLRSENRLVSGVSLLRVALGLAGNPEQYLKKLLNACAKKCPGLSERLAPHVFRGTKYPCEATDPTGACQILRTLSWQDPGELKRSCVVVVQMLTGDSESDAEKVFAESDFSEPPPPQAVSRRTALEEDTAAHKNAAARLESMRQALAAISLVRAPTADETDLIEQACKDIFERCTPKGLDAYQLLTQVHHLSPEEAYAMATSYGRHLARACEAAGCDPPKREMTFGGTCQQVRHYDPREHAAVIEAAFESFRKGDVYAKYVDPQRAREHRELRRSLEILDQSHAHSRPSHA
jgi:hypothetical protein